MAALATEVKDILDISLSNPSSQLVHDTLRDLERISVALMGHKETFLREFAVRLLNTLYDGMLTFSF